MIIIDKKVIKKISYVPWGDSEEHERCVDWKDLLANSQEVDVLDIDFEYQYFLEEYNEADTLGEYFTKQGYKLIKIKE